MAEIFPKSITMRACFFFLLLAFFSGEANGQASDTASLSLSFLKKVKDGKLAFTKPEGGVVVSVLKNSVMRYDYALKLRDKDIEIRYTIWPLTTEFFDAYERKRTNERDTVWNPNKMHYNIPQVAYSTISGGQLSPEQVKVQNFSPAAVQKDFGAEEGSMFIGPVSEAFGQQYRYAMFTMIHKDYAADVYIMYLFKDQQALSTEFPKLLSKPAIVNAIRFIK